MASEKSEHSLLILGLLLSEKFSFRQLLKNVIGLSLLDYDSLPLVNIEVLE